MALALTKAQTALAFNKIVFQPLLLHCSNLYTTSKNFANKSFDQTGKGNWLRYNQKVYEPQNVEDEPRPAVNKLSLFISYFTDFSFSLFVING